MKQDDSDSSEYHLNISNAILNIKMHTKSSTEGFESCKEYVWESVWNSVLSW